MALVELIPLDVLFGDPDKRWARLSPDGQKVGFLAPREGVMNVWVSSWGKDDARPVTNDRGQGIDLFCWAHDNRHLMFLQDHEGDENWRLHTVDLTTGNIEDRTPLQGVQARILGSSKRTPDEVLVGLNADDPRYHDVYRLDLGQGTLVKEIENPGFEDWLIDNDLVVRGASRPREDGGVDYVLRDGEEWRDAFTVSADDFVLNITYPVGFSGDNKRLLMTSAEDSDTSRLVSVDLTTGEREVVASDPTCDLYGVDTGNIPSTIFHPDTREPQLIAWFKDRAECQVLDPSLAPDVERVRAAARGQFGIASRDDEDRRWIIYDETDAGSPRFLLYDRAAGECELLFEVRPALNAYQLASMEPFSFASRDGLNIHGYVTFPPGVERTELPAVLEVHGGPWGYRHFWGFEPDNQWLANRGYACIQINFRGSGSYGKGFLNASAREWGGRMHDDLLDGLEDLIGRGWIDRERVGIFGGSYGGYAALVGAAFTPDVFRCAVDYVGPSNLITMLESFPPYWFGITQQFHKLLGNPECDRDFLWERSPLSRVDDIRIPLLIAQGANDPRVKQAESEQIVAALSKRGIEHEYLLFEDEGHGFVQPENRRTFYRAAEHFLARHLGGRTPNTGDD